MNFAIMRAKKLKTMGSVAAALQHCYRERTTPNADENRTPKNQHLVARSTSESMGLLRQRLPEKRRKDAVLAVEYLMSASPEWWQTATKEQKKQFFVKSFGWLARKYGKANILTASIHLDETTPHLSAFVVPLTADGRLSAKEFIGNRQKMSHDQTDFAQSLAELGLERGVKGSRAKHQRVKAHYATMQDHQSITVSPEELKPKILKKKMFGKNEVETSEQVAERISREANQAVQLLAEKAAQSLQDRRRVKEQAQALVEVEKRLEDWKRLLEGLSQEQVAELVRLAKKAKATKKQKGPELGL